MRTRFRNYNFTPWRLFPARGSGGGSQRGLELNRSFWTQNYLYFPIPETGIHGEEFSLLVSSKELPETFVVRFSLR